MSDAHLSPEESVEAQQAALRLAVAVGELGLRLYGYRVALIDDTDGRTRLALIVDFGLDDGAL